MAERYVALEPGPAPVRTTVRERLDHSLDVARISGATVQTEVSDDGAHRELETIVSCA